MSAESYALQGTLFDNQSSTEADLYFASIDDIDELCQVIQWAYRGKPSTTSPEELYSGWISEQHILTGARITPEELRSIIENPNELLLVAKIKTPERLKIVGCCKISPCNDSLQRTEEEKTDFAMEIGLHAVDPDYQSRRIGSLLLDGVISAGKKYYQIKRIYCRIFSMKDQQAAWLERKGFINTKRQNPFIFEGRFKPLVDPEKVFFLIFTKRLE